MIAEPIVKWKNKFRVRRRRLTEQEAFLDGYDNAGQREEGTRQLLDHARCVAEKRGGLTVYISQNWSSQMFSFRKPALLTV